ncbi:hypothetical protein [Aquabacterium sp.]|uniref:hypothetical protein n=1 Tax=Aquabacterium sp. TaxID=1872578 RepID=UPI0035B3FCE4
MKHPLTLIRLGAVLALSVGATWSAMAAGTGSNASSSSGTSCGRPPEPPPEAYTACASLSEGAACTVSSQRGTMSGTCRKGPGGQSRLSCAPARPDGQQGGSRGDAPPPPPQGGNSSGGCGGGMPPGQSQ